MSRSQRSHTCMKTKHFRALEYRRHRLVDCYFLYGLTDKESRQLRRLEQKRNRLLTPFYAPILARLETGEL